MIQKVLVKYVESCSTPVSAPESLAPAAVSRSLVLHDVNQSPSATKLQPIAASVARVLSRVVDVVASRFVAI